MFFLIIFFAQSSDVWNDSFTVIFDKEYPNLFVPLKGQEGKHEVIWGAFDPETEIKSAELVWNSETHTPRPAGAVQIKSVFKYGYGHYSARLKTPNCPAVQPKAGVISGFFTYFEPSPPEDLNQNGINDISEIDFEFLCADPHQIHITAHTDYGPLGGGREGGWRTTRCFNTTNGSPYFTKHVIDYGKETPLDQQPKTVETHPEFLPYYYNVYGFDYYKDRIDYWMKIGEKDRRIELWSFISDAWIPNRTMNIFFNLWWTPNWSPEHFDGQAIERPTFNPKLNVEWIKYDPLTENEKIRMEAAAKANIEKKNKKNK